MGAFRGIRKRAPVEELRIVIQSALVHALGAGHVVPDEPPLKSGGADSILTAGALFVWSLLTSPSLDETLHASFSAINSQIAFSKSAKRISIGLL